MFPNTLDEILNNDTKLKKHVVTHLTNLTPKRILSNILNSP
jgi:hypothetical protein